MIATRDEAHLTLEISLAAIFSVEMLSSSRMYGRHPRVGAFMERTAMDLNVLWIAF
jgi:hypothetical protein